MIAVRRTVLLQAARMRTRHFINARAKRRNFHTATSHWNLSDIHETRCYIHNGLILFNPNQNEHRIQLETLTEIAISKNGRRSVVGMAHSIPTVAKLAIFQVSDRNSS